MSTTLPSFVNPMMTLAAVGATSATERPSGESLAAQQQRILAGMNAQLADTSLATAGQWTVTWLALTADRANLVYVATGPDNQLAVCLRGTVVSSLVDIMEDLEVGTVLPFGGGNVSQGAMRGFTAVTSAVNAEGTPATLLQTLTALIDASSSPQTVYVTGHSLGGALATMVAVYLSQQRFGTQPVIQLVTFAGPTAGDRAFAAQVNGLSPAPVLVVNRYDAIPQAWASLSAIDRFYPHSIFHPKTEPGPVATLEIKALVSALEKLPGSNAYVQPAQQPALNSDYAVFDPDAVGGRFDTTLSIFAQQVVFQHAGNTYLTLLGAPTLPAVAPTVTAVSPAIGATAGGTAVTITGTNFSPDSVVDFGIVPGTGVTVVSDTEIQVTSPALVGTVDVQVTNRFGTSPANAADRFTAPLSGG